MPTIKQQVEKLLEATKGVADEDDADLTAEQVDGIENPSAAPKGPFEAGFTDDVNRTAVMPSFAEDVAALTDGEEGLTEAFKTKAATIFEAAVMSRVKAEAQRLQEAFDERLAEAVEAEKKGLIEKVDGYLDVVVEEWKQENELALDRGIRTEVMENFFEGLHSLFVEHNIFLPEDKFDVLEAKEATIETLSQKLDEQLDEIVALRDKVALSEARIISDELAKGLAETEKEKFRGLVEDIDYSTPEDFRKKATQIRESYFKTTPTTIKTPVSGAPVVIVEEQAKKPVTDPLMARILADLGALNQHRN